MRLLVLLIFIVFSGDYLFAQTVNFDWAKELGSDIYNIPVEVTTDAAGNIYSTGYFNGTGDFDPGPGVFNLTEGGIGMYISKLDANGNFLWAKSVSGAYPTSLFVDNNGILYVTGKIGLGVFNTFIYKIDGNGNYIWTKKTDVTGVQNNYGKSIKVDATGNVYVTGLFGSIVDFDPGPGVYNLSCPSGSDMFVLKLDVNGNFLWVKAIIGNENESPNSLSLDKNDNIIITGLFTGTPDFDPGIASLYISCLGNEDLFVLKMDSNGNLIFAKSIGGPEYELGISVVTGNNNSIYIMGNFNSTTDFDPNAGVYSMTSSGNADIFIVKLDPLGNFIWAKKFGGFYADACNQISIDVSQNLYLTGYFEYTTDLDPGTGSHIFNADGMYNTFLLKLNSQGNYIWARQLKGSYTAGASVCVDALKNIISTGIFTNTVDFDPDAGVYNLNAICDRGSIYVHKMNQSCTASSFTTLNISSCNNYTLNGETYYASGTYSQALSNYQGCDSLITLNLIINRKYTNQNISICEGTFFFAGGENRTLAGTYKDTLLTFLGCDSILTTNISVNPKPLPNLGPDRNLCLNAPLSITPGVFSKYLWQDNSTLSNFTINSKGKYWVTVTNANNCSATDTLQVLAVDTIPKNFLPAVQLLCYNSIINLKVPGFKNYLWSTGDISNSVALNNLGTYWLTVTDSHNCNGTDTFTVQKNTNCIPIGIPNAFSPNRDGLNDIFKPTIMQQISDYHFMVFNRYGQMIFETENYGTGWDGTFKGSAQPRNSYAYMISFKNINGLLNEYNGIVTLIR